MSTNNPPRPDGSFPADGSVRPQAPEAHSTYTSVPATPAGYSFTPPASASPAADTESFAPPATPSTQAPTESLPAGDVAARAGAASSGPLAGPMGTAAGGSGSVPPSAPPANPFAAPAGSGNQGGLPGQEGTRFMTYPPAQPSSSRRPRRRRPLRRPGWGGVVVTSLVTALVASGATVVGVRALDAQGTPSTALQSTSSGGTTRTVAANGTSPDWEAVTDAVADSVVAITVATKSGTAVGSGVVYDSAGHIITNNHVVAGATQIQVTLTDGRIYEASLTGTDPATDLAVIALKNAPSNLTVAQFGDSSTVVTGEDVMAIGNPLGLSSTVTTGIVSAVDRPVVTTQNEDKSSQSDSDMSGLPGGLGELLRPQSTSQDQTFTNAIQIDAAINPGNSGGPLFDESGKVIGITSSIAQVSQESGSIGLGFAIPGNLAAKVADQLIADGKATHAYLGVTIADGAAQADGSVRAGAEVGSVEAGSPAASGGVRKGDVIVALNGRATSQAAALTGFVRQYSAGDKVTLTLIRDGQALDVTVVLAERQDS